MSWIRIVLDGPLTSVNGSDPQNPCRFGLGGDGGVCYSLDISGNTPSCRVRQPG
jgi:hypothetical protein